MPPAFDLVQYIQIHKSHFASHKTYRNLFGNNTSRDNGSRLAESLYDIPLNLAMKNPCPGRNSYMYQSTNPQEEEMETVLGSAKSRGSRCLYRI